MATTSKRASEKLGIADSLLTDYTLNASYRVNFFKFLNNSRDKQPLSPFFRIPYSLLILKELLFFSFTK